MKLMKWIWRDWRRWGSWYNDDPCWNENIINLNQTEYLMKIPETFEQIKKCLLILKIRLVFVFSSFHTTAHFFLCSNWFCSKNNIWILVNKRSKNERISTKKSPIKNTKRNFKGFLSTNNVILLFIIKQIKIVNNMFDRTDWNWWWQEFLCWIYAAISDRNDHFIR